jgi:hypothetical protein
MTSVKNFYQARRRAVKTDELEDSAYCLQWEELGGTRSFAATICEDPVLDLRSSLT